MARIDVLKEEIAEAREKRRNADIDILFGVLICLFVNFNVFPIHGEAKIWTIPVIAIVVMFGCG